MTRTVIAVVDDLFFASKIRATAEHLKVNVRFVRNVEAIKNAARETQAALIVVDLHTQKLDPIALAIALKADTHVRSIPLLAFFSHVETDLKREATKAGYDSAIPRSLFSRDLGKILVGQEGGDLLPAHKEKDQDQ